MDNNQEVANIVLGGQDNTEEQSNEGESVAIENVEGQASNELESKTPIRTKMTVFEGMIAKQAEAYAEAESDEEREDILAKYPKARDLVKKQGEELRSQLTGGKERQDELDADLIAQKAAQLIEAKSQKNAIQKLLLSKGIKGTETIEKLSKATTSLLGNGFDLEAAVNAVVMAKTKTQPEIPRGVNSNQTQAPVKKGKYFHFDHGVNPNEWYK